MFIFKHKVQGFTYRVKVAVTGLGFRALYKTIVFSQKVKRAPVAA